MSAHTHTYTHKDNRASQRPVKCVYETHSQSHQQHALRSTRGEPRRLDCDKNRFIWHSLSRAAVRHATQLGSHLSVQLCDSPFHSKTCAFADVPHCLMQNCIAPIIALTVMRELKVPKGPAQRTTNPVAFRFARQQTCMSRLIFPNTLCSCDACMVCVFCRYGCMITTELKSLVF